jgi:hypothetical protein
MKYTILGSFVERLECSKVPQYVPDRGLFPPADLASIHEGRD